MFLDESFSLTKWRQKMRIKLILVLLIAGISCYSRQIFAERRHADDGGYSESELKDIERMSDAELKQMRKYWERKDREADRKMIDATKKMRKARGELTRTKKGGFAVKDLITSQGSEESRIKRAQDKYDRARREWEKARDEHSTAVYKKGVSDIYLRQRKNK
jgi:ParB-like chromosome segregation protein Spo0J